MPVGGTRYEFTRQHRDGQAELGAAADKLEAALAPLGPKKYEDVAV